MSISTAAPKGRDATATVVRAGYGASKCRPYTAFIAAKSRISVKYTLALMTSAKVFFAAARTASTFLEDQLCLRRQVPFYESTAGGVLGDLPAEIHKLSGANRRREWSHWCDLVCREAFSRHLFTPVSQRPMVAPCLPSGPK